jgi:hypothetical protein
MKQEREVAMRMWATYISKCALKTVCHPFFASFEASENRKEKEKKL